MGSCPAGLAKARRLRLGFAVSLKRKPEPSAGNPTSQPEPQNPQTVNPPVLSLTPYRTQDPKAN